MGALLFAAMPVLRHNHTWSATRAGSCTLPTIYVTSSEPGTGKTGVAAAIARHYAYQGVPTTLVRFTGAGNAEADYILGGGFPANSINIIMGHPGSGKTIFAEQLIFHNAGDDRPILYFTTLSEPLAKVVRYLQDFRFFDEAKLGT